jgi:site-specific recombinase XerD
MLEQGTDIYEIKRLLGHSSIKTTYQYIHLTPDWRKNIISPLDILYGEDDDE